MEKSSHSWRQSQTEHQSSERLLWPGLSVCMSLCPMVSLQLSLPISTLSIHLHKCELEKQIPVTTRVSTESKPSQVYSPLSSELLAGGWRAAA